MTNRRVLTNTSSRMIANRLIINSPAIRKGPCSLFVCTRGHGRHLSAATTIESIPPYSSVRRYFSCKDADKPSTMVAMDVVKRIKQDLVDADVNHDQRVDFEELKLILGKYSNVFSEDDVQAIGELFFVGKGGKSVTHTTFLRGMLHTASADTASENPLGLESCSDERCFVSGQDDGREFYNTQQEFDKHLFKYIQELVERKSTNGIGTTETNKVESFPEDDDDR